MTDQPGNSTGTDGWSAQAPEHRADTPLSGVRVLEFVGLGPAPFAGMMLADLGADVLRVDRPGAQQPGRVDILTRGRAGTVGLDLKSPAGRERALELVAQADVLLEGFRPGVMERLGLGPTACAAVNERLVYGRVTGWGQDGPLATTAGHDINYLAVTGALDSIRRQGELPVPPLNLVGDYGAGGMLLLSGVLAALVGRGVTGRGRVIDASMMDGTALLLGSVFGLRANGEWNDEPGTNRIDTGAPFYNVYETSDGRFMAVGCIEPQFYAMLLHGLDIDPDNLPAQNDRAGWPQTKKVLAQRFAERTREEWAKVFRGTDACVTPVASLGEAAEVGQMRHRATLRAAFRTDGSGYVEPAPAPRFAELTTGAHAAGADTRS